jgi:energy-coupling factor transporter transmembrane protein EcfT
MLQATSERTAQTPYLTFDPRTKLFMVMIISIFMMSGSISGYSIYPRMVLAAVPCLLLFTVGRVKAALLYASILASATCAEVFLVFNTRGILNILITMLSGFATRFIPSVVMGYYLIVTTTVSQFIAAMERIHLPKVITIPLAVMFRFFPTIREESCSINDAMRMRGMGTKSLGNSPVSMLEYRFVPLMASVVKTGEELTVSALTRGLGGLKKRTNICEIGFGFQDLCLSLIVLAAAFSYAVLS